MPFNRYDIRVLADELMIDLGATTTLDVFVADVIESLGQVPNPPFVGSTTLNVSTGTQTNDYPAGALRLLHMILGEKELYRDTERSLNAYKLLWSSDTGTPIAFYEDKKSKQYSLYPIPNFTSGATIRSFYAEDRDSGIQDYYGLPLSLLCIVKEFTYSNVRQDPDLAQAAMSVAAMLMRLLKHDIPWDKKRK